MAILSNKSALQYPRSPRGKASLVDLATEPSHRLAGSVLVVAFRADPTVVREYVPEPLELDGSGLVFLRNVDQWIYSERNATEFITPSRINFTESFFWIPCDYKGERYHYMPFSWVNRDWLAYLGRTAGQPHKIAKVQMTRFHPSDPTYHGPHEGVRCTASVEGAGLVLRAWVDLKRSCSASDLPFKVGADDCPKYLGNRYVYDVTRGKPIRHDLVVHWGDGYELNDIWGGDAGLTFFEAENEEVLPFQPLSVIGGWWYRQLFNHSGMRPSVLHSFI